MRHLRSTVLAFALLPLGCSSGGGDGQVGDGPGTPPPVPAPPSGAPPPADVPKPTALFVLGDSYSDVGNAASTADYLLSRTIEPPTVGLCNPADVLSVPPRACTDLFYGQRRVSDGPVAVEHLAEHLQVPLAPSFHVIPNRPSTGTNYAVASAKARGPDPEDLGHQVDRLLLDQGSLPADAVYVVLIGGNDAIDALQLFAAGGPAAAQASDAIISAAVAAIGANIERLLDFGARRLVIGNVPDLAALPAVRLSARSSGNEAALLARARALSEAFDRELRARLEPMSADLRWSVPATPALVRFDLRAALALAQQAADAGGGNGRDACFDSEAYRQSQAAERVFHPDCAPQPPSPPRFADFAFWDGIHPTGAAHRALGDALIDVVAAELAD